jgi:hypothetical protein
VGKLMKAMVPVSQRENGTKNFDIAAKEIKGSL